MIIPGSYIKYGDPIGGDCGHDTTNGLARYYPRRCHKQTFENRHVTSLIRKNVWIDRAMIIIKEKERTVTEDVGEAASGTSFSTFYNQVNVLQRVDLKQCTMKNSRIYPIVLGQMGYILLTKLLLIVVPLFYATDVINKFCV